VCLECNTLCYTRVVVISIKVHAVNVLVAGWSVFFFDVFKRVS
jgi:hypothetical protein